MRVSVEWFLLDNFAINWLLLRLAGALGGVALRGTKAALLSLLGALWDLVALARFPSLLSLWGRIGCLLATALLMSRKEFTRALASLVAASLLLGGGLLLLTLGRAGPALGGVLLGTVKLRAAVYGLLLFPLLLRGIQHLVHRGYEQSLLRPIVLTVGQRSWELVALVDSGNLLTEPLSGLPVMLVEGVELPSGRPLMLRGQGTVEVVPATVIPAPGREPVSVFVGVSPLPLGEFQALLPGAALHEGGFHAAKTEGTVLSALRQALHAALSLLSGALRRKPAGAAVAGGGDKIRAAEQNQRGGPQHAHRAQFAPGGVHREEV